MIQQQMRNLFGEWGIRCSVTGDLVPLIRMKYWNMERNEAYRDANIMFKRHMELRELKNHE